MDDVHTGPGGGAGEDLGGFNARGFQDPHPYPHPRHAHGSVQLPLAPCAWNLELNLRLSVVWVVDLLSYGRSRSRS